MGYKAENKLLTAAFRRIKKRMDGNTPDDTTNTASRKAANEKKRKRKRQIADAVKRWRQKHRAEYNAYMKVYQAGRRVLVTQSAY